MKMYEPGWISSQAPDSISSMNVPLPAPVTTGQRMPACSMSSRVVRAATAAASTPAFELDVDVERGARAGRGGLQVAHVAGVVRAPSDARALRERGEPLELRRADHFVRHQDIGDSRLDHRLGLGNLLAANADRAGGDLALRDLREIGRGSRRER